MQKIRVGVIMGGRSGEHEVSLVSAASVMHALDRTRYEIIPIGIEKSGRWVCGENVHAYLTGRASAGDATAASAVHDDGLPAEGVRCCILPPDPTQGPLIALNSDGTLERIKVDVVFPVLHGTFGEDGTIQGLFEMADIAYVGAGVLGSSVGMDKIVQKELFRAAGLPVVESVWFYSAECTEDAERACAHVETVLGYPVFVKPPNLGSSVGISKARTHGELRTALALAASFDRTVLVERAVPSPRELEVAVLGNRAPVATLPGEIVPSNEFYDYDAKYVDGASAITIPADIPAELAERVRALALRAYAAVHCEGMARVDFLVARESGELFLNEINTIPGFTSISMYSKMFAHAGVSYPELLDRLIALALERRAEQHALRHTYEPSRDWHRTGTAQP